MARRLRVICCVRPSLLAIAVLCGCGDPSTEKASLEGATSDLQRTADLLIARSNCVACHSAPESMVHAGSLPAPSLAGIGDRAGEAWIAKYLASHPHVGSTGMRMPDLLSGLGGDHSRTAIEDLAAYLASRRAIDITVDRAVVSAVSTFPAQLNSGERLWGTLGCVACHPAGSEGSLTDESWLVDKWTRPELVQFLLDPAGVWPGGQMPQFELSIDEATAIASYLLRGQGKSTDGTFALTKAPGVSCRYFEGAFIGTGPSATLLPARMDAVLDIDIPPFARADAWGMRLSTTLTIPTSGMWTLWLGSDDGSSLTLDGALLMESPGVHGFDWKSATLELPAGPHELLVTYFEGAGNADLRLEWKGPGVERERVPQSAYTREAIPLRAVTHAHDAPAVGYEQRVQRGRNLFVQSGCVQCHGSPETATDGTVTPRPDPRESPLASLDLTRGCLSEHPRASDAPDFGFSPSERTALQNRLADLDSLRAALPATESLALHLLALNCTGCHARSSVGQPTAETLSHFEGTADIGEQGRVPPTLDDAGAKLRTSAIDTVLAGHGRVRPYLLARMPRFGSKSSAPLSALFAAADHAPAHESDPPMRPEVISEGQQLVGSEGFACIACHGCAGYAPAGSPAIDLSYTYARIRHSWFERYMRNPAAIYPGTRMPSFWQPGQRVHTEILGGDPAKQISAIWSYLALGSSMPLPKGLVPGSAYELAPTTRPIMLGTFMDGLSARCFAVGFKEQVHFVYDAEHRRTAKAWRGKFMDATGTWFGRAGLLCEPAGIDVISFPPGDAVAVLSDPRDVWPTTSGRESGWRFLGIDRDLENVPTFRTALGEIEVEERLSPARAVGGAHLVREFVIRASHELAGVMLRVWTASAITQQGDGWKAEGGPTLFVRGGGAFVHDGALLVPVGFATGADPNRPYEARVLVEYAW